MHISIIPGLIPKLVREGFTGTIWCTEATRDLTEILLYDSAEIQTYETESINKKRAALNLPLYEPLYTSDDVTEALKRFEVIEYNNLDRNQRRCDRMFYQQRAPGGQRCHSS
jgi:metallo-beta-lactamase family protein